MDVVSQYNLDGVEFECALHSILIIFSCSRIHSWEYPGKQGIGCNVVSANDSANFLSFLQTFRCQDGAQSLILSAAVTTTPFVGSDGMPLADVSGFADVLDYIGSLNPTSIRLTFCLTTSHRDYELRYLGTLE